MKSVALAVNPVSGSDIRRFSSLASSNSFSEKIQTALRAVAAAHMMGVERFILMPDRLGAALLLRERLAKEGIAVDIDDMPPAGTAEDTTVFACRMEEAGCGCLLTFGGDGTARAAARALKALPLLPISSGTNNVYPVLAEGTAAGIAAAGIAGGLGDQGCCVRDKRIELELNGRNTDIALIDAAVSTVPFVGAKAAGSIDELLCIVVTRCHPASIGLSAVPGCRLVVRDTDPYGAVMDLRSGERFLAPVTSGVITAVTGAEPCRIPLGGEYSMTAPSSGTVLLDGEREHAFPGGSRLSFRITTNGPLRVDIGKTCERMLENGAFARIRQFRRI